MWLVYALLCDGGGVYIGMTNNLTNRVKAHASGKGALYTRLHPPVAIVAVESVVDQQQAIRLERMLKRSHTYKRHWLSAHRIPSTSSSYAS